MDAVATNVPEVSIDIGVLELVGPRHHGDEMATAFTTTLTELLRAQPLPANAAKSYDLNDLVLDPLRAKTAAGRGRELAHQINRRLRSWNG